MEPPRKESDGFLPGSCRGRTPAASARLGNRRGSLLLERLPTGFRSAHPTARCRPGPNREAVRRVTSVIRRLRPARRRRDRPTAPTVAGPTGGAGRSRPLATPLQLCPSTNDVDEARAWMTRYAPAGIEGLVIKGLDSLYRGGSRDDWSKVKIRETQEVVVGAVVGPPHQPTAVIADRYRAGQLVVVGRTGVLTTAQGRALAGRLEPADDTHPWPSHIAANRFGKRRPRGHHPGGTQRGDRGRRRCRAERRCVAAQPASPPHTTGP